jgi:hypothetical protein
MRMAYRAVAVSVMLSLAWAGPLASFAAAQQPPPPAAPAPAAPPPPPPPPPAGAQPQMFQEDVKPEPPAPAGADFYDVGAVAITAFSLPLKAGICLFGLAAGTIITAMTFGTSPNASAQIVSEGCGGKSPWIVRGSDLRPKTPTSKAFDWETHRFDGER